jgi:hypothetical protein
MRCSPPVSSDVSPKNTVAPSSTSRSTATPTVGHEARPVVVSDSPHLMLTVRSSRWTGSRLISEAHCTNSFAFQEARRTVSRSPKPSMENAATGLPVSAMPSAILSVQLGSMPMTTTAATFGLEPVPIMVLKWSARSSPYCSRPYEWGSAIVPFMLFATASHAAFEMSSTGRTMTWFRTPTRPFSRL